MAQFTNEETKAVSKTIDPNGWTIVCVSDTHSFPLVNIPDADLLIHAGDFTKNGTLSEIEAFRTAFDNVSKVPLKFFIAGNHDLLVDPLTLRHPNWWSEYEKTATDLGLTVEEYHEKARSVISSKHPATDGKAQYLEDESCIVSIKQPRERFGSFSSSRREQFFPSLKIFGSPWQPEFFDWAFNLPRGKPLSEKWAAIPSDVDILVTHTPPYGILDSVHNGKHLGCEELRNVFDRGNIAPRLHVFGHIHDGYGVHFTGETLFVNAAMCNSENEPVNKPIVIFLPHDKTLPAQLLPYE